MTQNKLPKPMDLDKFAADFEVEANRMEVRARILISHAKLYRRIAKGLRRANGHYARQRTIS